MDFLKGVLGEELFNQIVAKINEYNGNDSNKDKQIKLGNLSSGEYIGKGKYDTLQNDLNSKIEELNKANALIDSMKNEKTSTEELQNKIKEYETEVENLKKEKASLQLENALKYALKEAGGKDVDYLLFKAKEHKPVMELGEDGKVKDIDNIIKDLKTSIPAHFESSSDDKDGRKVFDPLDINNGSNDSTVTKEKFKKMSYAERLKLKQESPDVYKKFTK